MPVTSSSASWRRRATAVLTGGVLAAALTACASTPAAENAAAGAAGGPAAVPDTSAILAAVQEDEQLAALLPAPVAQAGTLQLGSYLQSAPNNFYADDGSTPIGYEVDLAKAIAAKLGVTVTHQDMPFASLITSLQSGRVDATMAAMNDTPERQQQIDFVDYFRSGITIMVQTGNPAGIAGPDGLCGQAVAVVQGTSQQEFAAEQSNECTSAGQSPITVTATESDSLNQTQLRTGRVAAILNDLPTAVYVSRTAGEGRFFEVVPGEPINGGPYGIGVPKDDPRLSDAVRAALQALMADGTYGRILEAWGVQQGALEQAVVNGGS